MRIVWTGHATDTATVLSGHPDGCLFLFDAKIPLLRDFLMDKAIYLVFVRHEKHACLYALKSHAGQMPVR